MKCLEFHLPSGSAGMAAGMTRMGINKELKKLVDSKMITGYKSYTQGYKYYVWFKNDYDYTAFFLVWEQTNPWRHPKVIEKDCPEDASKNPQILSVKKIEKE